MKKSILLCVGIMMSTLSVNSCSTSSDELNVEEVQKELPILKTTNMLNFESALKNWYKSKENIDSNTVGENIMEANVEVANKATSLLIEMGVSETTIDEKRIISTDVLVYFTLDEYSNRLSQMYNINNK